MKNKIKILVFLFIFTKGLFATITYTPFQPNVDQQVTFTVTNPSGVWEPSVQRDFGDGTSASGSATVTKVYKNQGTFTVKVSYQVSPTAGPTTEQVSITIVERRKITFTPPSPLINTVVTFKAENFLSTNILWDFGDGTPPTCLSTVVTHTYTMPGTYTVKAKDWCGNSFGIITTTVYVGMDITKRKITYTPFYPAVNKPVTFKAENFYSNTILWDFGDGTKPECLSTIVNHTYTKTGTFTVKAWDWCGKGAPTSTTINVSEATGLRAPFQIFFIQLRFDDGKPYKVVPKDLDKLIAYADIKYEGTGILQAQWLVDGVPFKPLSTVLPFAKETVINSGEIPGLPTQFPGLHEVTLRIIQPQTEYQIPVLRYFVSLERAEKEGKKEIISIASLEISDIKGNKIPINSESIKAPSNEYIILRGKIMTEEERIPFSLLRIYLGDELIDQQIIRDLKPGEEREITTSINNSSLEQRKLYLLLYNISKEPVELIFLRQFSLLSEE